MRSLAAACAAVLLLSLAPLAGEACTCAADRAHGGWCDVHRLGHVAGVEIRSAELFEALDAHGHEIEDRFLDCDTCRRAKETDGFCAEHGRGFVGGLAYLSKLTYQLARGRTVEDPDAIECPVCRKNATSHGWCAKCGKGMVGSVEIDGRRAFDEVDHALHILFDAKKVAGRCELCAAAMVSDGRCPVCKISYEDGKAAGD